MVTWGNLPEIKNRFCVHLYYFEKTQKKSLCSSLSAHEKRKNLTLHFYFFRELFKNNHLPSDTRSIYLNSSIPPTPLKLYTISNYFFFISRSEEERGEKERQNSSHPLSGPISHSSNCLLLNLHFSHLLNVPSTLSAHADLHHFRTVGTKPSDLPPHHLSSCPRHPTPVGVGYLRPGVRGDAEVSVALSSLKPEAQRRCN